MATSEDGYASACPYCPKMDSQYSEQCKLYQSFDEVLAAVGPFGNYQKYICIIIFCSSLMWAGNYTFDGFGSMEPYKWGCIATNNTTGVVTNVTLHSCSQRCDEYVAIDRHFHGIVEQWTLICDRRWALDLLTIVPDFVTIGACLWAGHFGEWHGRRRGLIAFQFGVCLSSVLGIASRSWISLMVFRCISAFFWGAIKVSMKTLCLEFTSNKYRMIVTAVFQWSTGYMFIGLVAYLTRSWQMYLIIVNLVCAPVLLGFLVFLESPRWLLEQNRLSEAARALSDIASARWNKMGVTVLPQELEGIRRPAVPKKYSIIDLFRLRSLRRVTAIQICASLAYSFTNSAFFVRISQVDMDPFVAIVLYGALQAWIPVALIILDRRFSWFGRRTLFLLSLGIMVLSYGAALILHIVYLGEPIKHIEIMFIFIGTASAVTGFEMSIILITVEFYPTVLRNIALGTFYAVDYAGLLIMLIIVTRADASGSILDITYHALAEAMALLTFVLAYFWQIETKFTITTEDVVQTDVPQQNGGGRARASERPRHGSDNPAYNGNLHERREARGDAANGTVVIRN